VHELDRLTALVAPPPQPTPVPDRLEADGRSLALPADYAALLATYGPGTFGTRLQVLAPGMAGTAFDIAEMTRSAAGAARDLLDDFGDRFPPYPWWPEPGSLVLWGLLDDIHDLYWLTDGDDPDGWPVVAARAVEQLEARLEPTATGLIVALLERGPGLPDFLEPLPDAQRVFRPCAR
jgi:hypothetical protein